MARRIAVTTLNASTIDILNVIRQNASYDYQANVPVVTTADDIPKVGEVIYGTPAFANQFINALVNRIAMVRVQSATFNNPYKNLKKGYLEFGETIEDIFVNIAKVIDYSAEKGINREFRRTYPDVRSAFHVMNFRVMYPITIQDNDLKMAFLNMEGVQNLIAKIVDSVYTASEYDEYLLFKYLLIKAVSHGKFYPKAVDVTTDVKNSAIAFRGMSNTLPFMKNEYNEAGVKTTTPKERQIIFMDANFNAQFDVEVLASAFNMEKADFMGRLHLIDDWTTFDNERWEQLRDASDGIEEVSASELSLMGSVKAVIVDENWFQIYDNLNKMTEKYVASGLYWNYFYHTWKTVSYSPFANAVVFVDSNSAISDPASLTVTILSKDVSEDATVLTLGITEPVSLSPSDYSFEQTEALTEAGIAVHPYGAVIIPTSQAETAITLVAECGSTTYTASSTITSASDVGDTVTLAQ